MSKKTVISLLIPIHNGLSYTKKCLQNLYSIISEEQFNNIRIIIVDDGSTDGSSEWIKKNYLGVHLLNGDGNLWWSESINVAAKYALNEFATEYVLLWNNDIIADAEYFNILLAHTHRKEPSIILGSRILKMNKPKEIWSNGGRLLSKFGFRWQIYSNKTDSNKRSRIIYPEWLTGMGTLVPAEIIKDIGYWDSENFPQYFGDLEFTYRAKKLGYSLKVDPNLRIWNNTDNSRATLDVTFRQFFSSIFLEKSNRNIETEKKFMKKYDMYPIAMIGYLQRLSFATLKFLFKKVSS